MRMFGPPAVTAAASLALSLGLVSPLQAGHASFEVLGYSDLVARLGGSAPDGSGVIVAQVEVPDGDGDYGPNKGATHYVGKTFHEESGPTSTSSHANGVAQFQYGNLFSMAAGVNEIYLYEVEDWLTGGFLRWGAGPTIPPLPLPADISSINHSWVGTASSSAGNNEALRRADWVINRDNVMMTDGVNNDPPNRELMSHLYNSISVGVIGGIHVSDDTLPGADGPGRQKPEIVAGPNDFTSFATPMINAINSVLVETARTELSGNPSAERTDILKATILAGAAHVDEHNGEWSNNPKRSGPNRGVTTTPIDDVVGVGTANVNRSHFILTAGEFDGASTPPGATNAALEGWDLASVGIGDSRYYRFRMPFDADEVSILATWNRWVAPQFDDWALADFDLILWRVGAGGSLHSLVGDGGLPYFQAGNVVSESTVDNIEHLYINGLEAGEYAIELRRQDADTKIDPWDAAVAWIIRDPSTSPEDIDADGVVSFSDLLLLLSAWGPCFGCPEDIDGNGVVGLSALILVLSAWD